MLDKPKEMRPHLNLSAKDFPALKNWKVGGKYKLELDVEQISMQKDEWMEGEPLSASFRINKIEDVTLTDEEKEGRKGY